MSMSNRQRQPPKPNPLLSSTTSSSSSISSSSAQYPTMASTPTAAQYVDLRPAGSATGTPTTPFHSESTRLLPGSGSAASSPLPSSIAFANNNGSNPGSPMDFGVTPIPAPAQRPPRSSSAAVSAGGASLSSSPPSSQSPPFAPSPLSSNANSTRSPSTQAFSTIPNPFSAASRGGSTAAFIGPTLTSNNPNNNANSTGNNTLFTPPSRPASRGSITPFPASNVLNPPLSTGHPNSSASASASSSSASGQNQPHTPITSRFLNTNSGHPGGLTPPEDGLLATLGLGSGASDFPFPGGGGGGLGGGLGGRGSTGSMVLYRLAGVDEGRGGGKASRSPSASSREPLLVPPRLGAGGGGEKGRETPGNRSSLASDGGSVMSFADSGKYPFGPGSGSSPGASTPGGARNTHLSTTPSASASTSTNSVRGLVPYIYDPRQDENEPLDEEDLLHDPNPRAWMSGKYDRLASSSSARVYLKGSKGGGAGGGGGNGKGGGKGDTQRLKTIWERKHFPWRGVLNVGVLLLLILGLLCLFAIYPILTFYRDRARNARIEGNVRINGTGQSAALFQMPDMIDADTPESAKTRTGFDGEDYELVFSDEFETAGRTFWPGDDPFWEGVDLWYGATADLEWYDPSQLITRDGALIITMDSTSTTEAHLTPGSTAPFTLDDNHNMTYRSGMLQSWNKFCFTTGYIEVAVTFPGPDQSTQGYWPGAWTMGNLARPGYAATTDGTWPYTYDSCDVGTYPNQTEKDGSGPAAAVYSSASRSINNYALSWLPGQKLSACSCPGSDHPGPSVTRGRGAPEIDIFEAEKDKNIPIVGIVSQSGQFAPFTHDYLYSNDSGGWTNFDTTRTRANTYRGSAVQQSVSGLTRVPSDMFQGQPGGGVYRTFGFEYWSDTKDRSAGSITWQVDGEKSHRVIASAVGPDQGDGGTGVGQRIIPEEPMSIVLNLGISANWQTIDLTTMQFPAEMKVDYVRVYQRKGQTNTGCDPKNYPTADYIQSHLEAYTDVNMTSWPWEKPKNSQYDGC